MKLAALFFLISLAGCAVSPSDVEPSDAEQRRNEFIKWWADPCS